MPTIPDRLQRFVAAYLAAVALTAATAPLGAQRVRGTVRQVGGAIGVPGALVVARDSLGHELARTEADSTGRFDLVLPAPGQYRVAALRIGFRLATEGIVTAARGQAVALDLQVGVAIAELAPVQVRGRSSCSGDRTAAALAADYWERARVALASVDPLQAGNVARATLVTFDEVLDATMDSARSVFAATWSGETHRPFGSVAPDSIAVTGYVRDAGRSVEYYAPDAEVLLSSSFAMAHCFQAEPGPPGHPGWVGVHIEPQRSGDRADITGTLWLDQATSEPRELEYRYTGIGDEAMRAAAGGRVAFTQLPRGRSIVSHWWIRMPQMRIERTLEGVGLYQRVIDHASVAYVRVMGGEVASVQERGDTVYRAPGHVIALHLDAKTGVGGAALVEILGGPQAANFDATGRTSLTGLLPGSFRARVSFAASAGSAPERHDVVLSARGDRDTTDVLVAMPRTVVGAPAGVEGTGTIAGRVLRTRDSIPLGNALVSVDGTDLSDRTGNDGTFRISGVSTGEHALRVARIGYTPEVLPEAVTAGAVGSPVIGLYELPGWLNAVVIRGERRDIPPSLSEVYRRGASGFGNFFTLEDIERLQPYDIKSLFSTIPGVYWNDKGIVTFARCSGDFGAGADKVQVYVDGTKVTRYAAGSGSSVGVPEALARVPINDVQAVEVYRGVAEIPAEFLDDACAVIAIWTRRY